MEFISIFKTLLKVALVGPALSLRLGEMALASMQVITYRTMGITKSVKEPKLIDWQELYLMVREKIDGVIESVAAGSKHMLSSNSPTALALPNMKFISESMQSLFSSRSPIEAFTRIISLLISCAGFVILSSLRIFLSGSNFFKATTNPLRSRVVANARRLRKAKNRSAPHGVSAKSHELNI